MRILVTAFEPFGGETVNASLEALRRLAPPAGHRLIKRVLPVEFGRAALLLREMIRETGPEAVICLGQAAGRSAVTPERAALNVRDASIPDNAGFQPKDEPCVPGAPAAYFSTLPVRAMLEQAAAAGVPAAISNSAGTFVCNDVMYGLLHAVHTEFPTVKAGFIHLPCLPEQAKAHGDCPSMPGETAAKGLQAMLEAL